MNTPIKSISDDENIIEHESGVKTQFVEGEFCETCCYDELYDSCLNARCASLCRKDSKNGNFKQLLP